MLSRLQNLQNKITSAEALLKLPELQQKVSTLETEMNAPNFWQDTKRAQAIARDYESITQEVQRWTKLKNEVDGLVEIAVAEDESLSTELETQVVQLEQRYAEMEFSLLLSGPYDNRNAIVSIHAGSGGTEAQDWAEMLVRMITRFAEHQGYEVRVVDESRGQEAGYKSITFEVNGRFAFGYLKSEHGVHRLVRISPFDAEKMRHTSFALIEVLPEVGEEADVVIDPKDLRIDTFMSGGHGGQSVNTTYSAVRVVHIPTNITVSCQNERSQMQNKETALKILRSKLVRLEEEKKAKERQDLRGEYKSAEWGNQIRSYVLHPYHLVKDHRTDYESTDPEGVLEGELLPLSEAYLRWIKR